ncbi:MAG: hypothetical protein L0387_37095 [Acidobacteria bacterium]|nr:hypothetical protein [Acidobacteriota bacterium]MCI0627206.1 hypothetical protein [Acidobacteriota bacterium]MCI0718010.1 hypothetical protein [Acidobacteriota bacterium]
MPVVSITRLRVRSARYLLPFMVYSLLASLQARRSRGNLGVKLLRDENRSFWTATAWQNEEAMRSFMLAGAHRRAMPKLLDWCDEASLVHWSQETAELPDWRQAYRQIVEQGRPSKVRYPSPAHIAQQIPEPRV